jgi:hypothetical protein
MSRRGERRQVARLCRGAEALLTSLHLARTFTLPQLHEKVEHHRGRPVHLIPRRLPVLAPHGLWVAGDHADYVFYDRATGAVRQHQIIGHEFGHLLYDDGIGAGVDEVAAMLLPDVSPAVVTTLRQRSGYGSSAERRAEVFGTVALSRMAGWAALATDDAIDPAVLARLVATLEGGEGRC